MNRNIQNLAELKVQIALLSEEKIIQEHLIKNKIRELTNSLKPVNLIKNAFAGIAGDPGIKNSFKLKGAEAAIGFLVTQLLFKNANPIFRLAATVVGTSFAGKVFGADSPKYIEKIKTIFNKYRAKMNKPESGLFNEEDIYTG